MVGLSAAHVDDFLFCVILVRFRGNPPNMTLFQGNPGWRNKKYTPGRLTAGTCPHGGLVQIIVLSKSVISVRFSGTPIIGGT